MSDRTARIRELCAAVANQLEATDEIVSASVQATELFRALEEELFATGCIERPKLREQVIAFHQAFGQPILYKPTIPSVERLKLRARLVMEESMEFVTALGVDLGLAMRAEGAIAAAVASIGSHPCGIVQAADALGDIDYVVEGSRLEMGIDGQPIADEIHRSNMSKLGSDGKPIYREDGKAMKPPSWTAPDIAGVLQKQMRT